VEGLIEALYGIPGEYLPFRHCGIHISCDDGQRVLMDPMPNITDAIVVWLFDIVMYYDPIRIDPILERRLPIVAEVTKIDCGCVQPLITMARSWIGSLYNSVLQNCHAFCDEMMFLGRVGCYH